MARVITKELAEKIAKKLDAQKEDESGPHTLWAIYHEGLAVALFGIRRGSAKDLGHDHIPAQIHVGPGFAKLLGQCPKSREDWLAKLREKRIIPTTNSP